MLSVPVQLMGTQPTCCVCSQGFRDSILEQRNSERRHPSACFIVLCKTYCTHGSISLVGPPSKTIQGPPRPGASRPPGPPTTVKSQTRHGQKKDTHGQKQNVQHGERINVLSEKSCQRSEKRCHTATHGQNQDTPFHTATSKDVTVKKKIHGQKKAVHGQKKEGPLTKHGLPGCSLLVLDVWRSQ